MGIVEELKSRNFSIYGQWFGLLSILLLFIFGGIAFISNVIFSIIAWVIAVILLFVELPICLKVCPTSSKFDGFIRRFENNWVLTGGYLIFATVMFLSNLISVTSLNAAGIFLFFAGTCYGIAGIKKQSHSASKFTGGPGVVNVV